MRLSATLYRVICVIGDPLPSARKTFFVFLAIFICFTPLSTTGLASARPGPSFDARTEQRFWTAIGWRAKPGSGATSTGNTDQGQQLAIKVSDENGVPVAAALVILLQIETQTSIKGQTDYAGRLELPGIQPGPYDLRVEKEGFYAANLSRIRLHETSTLDITLDHQ